MKKVIAFLWSIIANPKKDIKKVDDQIKALKSQIAEIQLMPNKVEALVKLFQVISPLQDAGGFSLLIKTLRGKNYGQLNKVIEALQTLQAHFRQAGREQFGWNRTKPGEVVSSENVYLGDVFGIWTKTAGYWLANEDKLKKDFREDLTKDPSRPVTTWYCINDYQAGPFVKSHVEGILKQLSVLEPAI